MPNGQWTITVDYVPGQGFEAAVETGGSYDVGGFESEDIDALLASVATGIREDLMSGRVCQSERIKAIRREAGVEVAS